MDEAVPFFLSKHTTHGNDTGRGIPFHLSPDPLSQVLVGLRASINPPPPGRGMSKQKDDLPCRRHEMMSGREWLKCAAPSLSLVRYSRLIRSLYRRRLIFRAVFVSSFSLPASDPIALSLPFAISPCRHRPRLVPLVRLVRRRAWRGDVIRSCQQASRQATGAMSSVSSMPSMSSVLVPFSSPGVSLNGANGRGVIHSLVSASKQAR